LHGGWPPFWHTTVVELFGGTTTVVFAGGDGLELLMQPLTKPAVMSTAAAVTALIDTFIVLSLAGVTPAIVRRMVLDLPAGGQQRMSRPPLSVRLQHRHPLRPDAL
jgi:hypothetical protein